MLPETLTLVVVLPAATTIKTFATIDSKSDLIHFYMDSPMNAIGMVRVAQLELELRRIAGAREG
jgi:hypothetical protein